MDVGEACLLLALIFSLISTYAFISGSIRRNVRLLKIGEKSLHLTTAFLTSSLLLLTYYFIIDDFNVAYVYLNSDLYLPFTYKISAVWASKEGSLLLWVFYTSLLSSIFVNVEKKDINLAKSLAIVCVFLTSLILIMITTSNPFIRLGYVPTNGIGLNPLLRTPEMIFHPPTIFIGYATVIFPFAVALVSYKLKRNWIIFSWLFLTIGIFLGAWWAYKTLGWGGFWAWDPVENASLLPWVTLTALIHLMHKYKKESYFLVVISFILVIFATFVTRSGVIKSVHAFGESWQGIVYLALIVVFSGLSIYFYFKNKDTENEVRAKEKEYSRLSQERKLDRILSNQNILRMFLMLMLFFVLAVLVGTISNIFTAIERDYYLTTALPILGLIVALIGICFTTKTLKFSLPAALIASIIVLIYKGIAGALAVFISTFSIFFVASGKLNLQKISKILIHLGIILLFLGSTFVWVYEVKHENIVLERGKAVEIGDITIRYNDVFMKQDNEKFTLIPLLTFNNDQIVLKQFIYKIERDERVVNNVDVITTPLFDYYIALKGISEDFDHITIDFYIIPLISFVWTGFYLLMIGGYFALVRK